MRYVVCSHAIYCGRRRGTARRILDGYTCIPLPIYYYPLKRKQYGKTLDRSHIIVVIVSRVPTSQLLPTNTITYD
ncbi:hypothetical protein [Bacillus thuringiensis]|uniref:hypothetical protein n=1 Tax=Bacillus thuringiensis TaxID=1428 RepID=UPI0018CF9DD0|nr:hypothetical protein [Bacillus thuringiensis]